MSQDPRAERDTLYSQLFDLSPFPSVVSRLTDRKVLAVNARAAEVVGIAPQEAPGLTITDFYVDPTQRTQILDDLRRQGRADYLRVQVKRANGEPFWALASARLITWQGEPAVLSAFHDISPQHAAEASLRASERRLVSQSDALTALTSRYVNPDEPADERLKSILRLSAQALEVDRLSVWHFDDDRDSLRCAALYRCGADSFESGAVLTARDFPRYFEALERDRVIAADDARADERTRDFTTGYLIPNRIGSMLDVPLRQGAGAVGVLCAEHVGGARTWTVDEQNFAISVANLSLIHI